MAPEDFIPINEEESRIAIGKIAASVTRIEVALFGHPESETDKGLFGEVAETKEKTACLDKRFTRFKWLLIGSGLLGGGGLASLISGGIGG